jgi:glycosyltransferase involved in cell wall biosynthesis
MNLIARKAAEAASRAWFAMNRSAFKQGEGGGRRRLFVDVSVIMRHDAATGVQRAVRGLWNALAADRESPFEVVPVYAGRSHGYCHADPGFLGGAVRHGRTPVGVRAGDSFLALDLAAHYLPGCTEQLKAWRKAGATTHVVVYDLLPLERPEWFNARSSQHFARWFEVVCRHADQALCISDDVKRKLAQRLRSERLANPPVLGRVHLSGDISTSRPSVGLDPEALAVLERVRERPAVLMVGTIEPRKGHDAALAAFEHLWRQSPTAADLVLVGRPGWKTEALQDRLRRHPEAGRRLHWLPNATDQALSLLYQHCRAVLFASRAEGLGLPLAEAAMHNRWVLARDLPVFREQALPNVLFFKNDSPSALAAPIEGLLDTADRGTPGPATLPGWDWCARRLLDEIGAFAPAYGAAPLPLLASR